MDPKLVAMLRKLPLSRQAASAVLPLIGRYGAKGAVVLARSYLGPVADQVERRQRKAPAPQAPAAPPPAPAAPTPPATTLTVMPGGLPGGEPPRPPPNTNTTAAAGTPAEPTPAPAATKPPALDDGELAILGMAAAKLIYEAGELALHNPTVSAGGRHPEFKLDENGQPPALSLSHVVAATRLVRAYAAESAARKEAEAQAQARQTPRARLQAARGQQYALIPRYAYLPTSTNRGPR